MVTLGDRVTKNQVLAYISSPLGHVEITMTAPKDGIVIGQQTLPLVNEGDAVFHLDTLPKITIRLGIRLKTTLDKSLNMLSLRTKASQLALSRYLTKIASSLII